MTEVRAGSSEVRATATEELLPCPFCGGEVDLCKQKLASLDGSIYCYWHVIHRCPHGNYSETKLCGTKTEAVRAWNRRAED